MLRTGRAKATENLAEKGFIVDDTARLNVAKAIGYAVQRARLTLAEYAKGNYGFQSISTQVRSTSAGSSTKPQPMKGLLDGWARERKPVEKTVYEWTRVVRRDMANATPPHFIPGANLNWCR